MLFRSGVKKRPLEGAMKGSLCVAVFRSQLGFSKDRQDKLNRFVEAVIGRRKFYNLLGVFNFEKHRNEYFSKQIEFIAKNYGKATSLDGFSKQRFFCSAFVVACYSVVGIIGETAQSACRRSSGALRRK